MPRLGEGICYQVGSPRIRPYCTRVRMPRPCQAWTCNLPSPAAVPSALIGGHHADECESGGGPTFPSLPYDDGGGDGDGDCGGGDGDDGDGDGGDGACVWGYASA